MPISGEASYRQRLAEEESQEREEPSDPLTEAPSAGRSLLPTLLLLAAVALFVLVYRPSRLQHEEWTQTVQKARGRVALLEARIGRLREERDALENREPEAIRDAAREALRQGRAGEFFLP